MKLLLRFSILLAMVAATSFPLQSGFTALPPECDPSFGDPVVGIGTRSQLNIHYRLFMNRYHSPAQRNPDGTIASYEGGCRDDTQGLVTFTAASDLEVLRSILFRQEDSLGRVFTLYGLGRPLTTVEKYRAESQLGAGRFLGVPYNILHLPLWVDGVGLAYNLSCPTGNAGNRLHLTSSALSQMFSGASTGGLPIKWSDPVIAATNPHLDGDAVEGIPACDQTVRVAVRADASDQTTVFKDFLAKQNPQYRPLQDPKLNTQWPATLLDPCRGLGDGGMATCVNGQSGSIGYISFPEAFRQGVKLASVFNRAGSPEVPSLEGCTVAADSPTAGYPSHARDQWQQVSLTDGPLGYPICSLQYGLVFEFMKFSYLEGSDPVSEAEVRTIKTYLKWAVVPATQTRLADFGLAPLPEGLRSRVESWTNDIIYAP